MNVYRLILDTPEGAQTGATYQGCSRENQDACDPRWFRRPEEAVAYAEANNEIPVFVQSVDEAWDIVEGRKAPESGGIGSELFLWSGALFYGVGAFFLYKLFFKKRG